MGKAKSNALPAEAATTSNVTAISAARKKPSTPPAATEGGEGKAAPALEPHLVVFGLDDGGKAHASAFAAADAELAIKAAGLMGYRVLPITTDKHRAAASGLAAGRVFASGKAFSPFAKMAAYEALNAFSEAYRPPAPVEPEPEPAPVVTGKPQRWEEIIVGSLVLANAGDDWGWHEAIVTEARGDDLFVLRWQGWPDDPAFARRRDGLGLLSPPAAEPSALVADAPAPFEPTA